MLRTSRDIAPEYREVTDRIKGVVFLATPHNGSAIARYVQALRVLRSGPAIKELESNAALLRDLNQWFRKNVNIKGLRVRAYFETINTKGIRVVDEDSADPVIDGVVAVGIDADHIAICKPPEQDVRVKQTLALIGDVLREREQRVPNVEPSYIRTALACRFEDLERLKREIELYRKDRPEDAEAKQALLYIAGVRILGPTCGKYVTKAMRTVLQFLK
jgi:hypothetical protein